MKLADNNNMHKISDKFENASDKTIRRLVRHIGCIISKAPYMLGSEISYVDCL